MNTNDNKNPKNPHDKKPKNPYRSDDASMESSMSSFIPPVSKHNQKNHENQHCAALSVKNNHNNAHKLHIPSDMNSTKRGDHDSHAAHIQSNHYNGCDTPCVSSNPCNRFTSAATNEKNKTNCFTSNLCTNQNSSK